MVSNFHAQFPVSKCGHCDIVQDNSVIFFEVYHKNEMKKLKESDFS